MRNPFFCQAAMLGIVILGLAAAAPAGAEVEDVDFSVEVRWRPETTRTQLTDGSAIKGFGGNVESRQFLRTRMSAHFKPDNAPAQALVELQDARTLGTPESGSVTGDDNLGIHQAFLHITELFHENLGLTAGRFELEYGNGRVMSAVNWSNTGRSFDGAKVTLRGEGFELDVVRAKLVERAESNTHRDADLYAAIASLEDADTEVFLLYDYDSRKVDESRQLRRWTAGTHSSRQVSDAVDFVANGAYQFGTQLMPDASAPSGLSEFDIAAFMASLELGFSSPSTPGNRAHIGVDFTSGDDPSSASYNSFNNEYYTAHEFRGAMDQFEESNPEGLIDLYAGGKVSPAPGWAILGEAHLFRTAQDFEHSMDMSAARSLGAEVDLSMETSSLRHANLAAGGALFFPTEAWRGANPEIEAWGFVQVLVNLD